MRKSLSFLLLIFSLHAHSAEDAKWNGCYLLFQDLYSNPLSDVPKLLDTNQLKKGKFEPNRLDRRLILQNYQNIPTDKGSFVNFDIKRDGVVYSFGVVYSHGSPSQINIVKRKNGIYQSRNLYNLEYTKNNFCKISSEQGSLKENQTLKTKYSYDKCMNFLNKTEKGVQGVALQKKYTIQERRHLAQLFSSDKKTTEQLTLNTNLLSKKLTSLERTLCPGYPHTFNSSAIKDDMKTKGQPSSTSKTTKSAH